MALSGKALPLLGDASYGNRHSRHGNFEKFKIADQATTINLQKTNRCQTIKVKKLQESVKIEASSVKNAMMFFSVLQDGKIRHVKV